MIISLASTRRPSRRGLKALLFTLLAGSLADAGPVKPVPIIGPQPSPSYFFTIDLDPRYQFVGTGAMTEDTAQHANGYHFIYNPDGKLREIDYARAGKPMPDAFLGVARIEFEYEPGIERRWFRDEQGKPVRDLDGIYGEELTLNAAGFPTEVTNLDEKGGHLRDNSGVIQYVRTLDEHNRLLLSRRVGLFGSAITDKNGYFEKRVVYDQQGRPIEQGNYDEHGGLLNNDDGTALIRTTYTIYPDSLLSIDSYFDASGVAVEEKRSGVHQIQRSTDLRGFVLDEAYFDATGAPTETSDDGVHERRYTYDERGNETREEFFGSDGKPANLKRIDIARVDYKYNENNLVSEKTYYGDDGAPQISPTVGAAKIRQEYDARGNLVRRLFLDGQDHPSQHVQYLAAAIRIKVEGDTTTVMLRNDEDKPAKNPVSGYSSFSYKTDTDHPLSLTNKYYDLSGGEMSQFRVRVINPHLHKLKESREMKWSARAGAAAAGLGSLLAGGLALIKSSHTKRRKVYVPSPLERFFGWFAVLAILEGTLRFVMTVYWAWVNYQNGSMGRAFYFLETLFILFFLYRLYRLNVTMRVLNIERDDLHRLLRSFFTKAGLKAEWLENRRRYLTPPLDVRADFFESKYHAYLAFTRRGSKGKVLASELAAYIRAQTGGFLAPARSRAIAFYYPCVAVCYFLLASMAFYTLYQLLKGT